ncbi:hypothetical protein P5673_021826 [Acropora cervicornis]|uniref:Uncharacterized protein n=1 Tax=Acropora cervicornis TaxID=6130 RepID=A0AAD9V019_ACRCE|nr:hypothetical protein P5673_021826 [Acropora cervicornis]
MDLMNIIDAEMEVNDEMTSPELAQKRFEEEGSIESTITVMLWRDFYSLLSISLSCYPGSWQESGPKSCEKSTAKPRQTSVYMPDRSALKSIPLKSHLVLYSLMYLSNTSRASGIYAHFFAFFTEESGQLAAFLFPFDLVH